MARKDGYAVLVCGGRDYDPSLVAGWLERNIQHRLRAATGNPNARVSHVIHGGARGADSGAAMWADKYDIPQDVHYPDWKKYGAAAGPIRNAAMLDCNPDLVIAFPGGKGTADMVRRARSRWLHVWEVWDGEH